LNSQLAGQGNGLLTSDELPLGLIFAGANASAVDWVGAQLLDYDSRKIPLLMRHLQIFTGKSSISSSRKLNF
jgi:uncharacterized protein (DUF362 family)